MDIMKAIIETSSGCKITIPDLEAMAPVMNGSKAEPACPHPAIHPIDPVRSQRGSTRPAWGGSGGFIMVEQQPRTAF